MNNLQFNQYNISKSDFKLNIEKCFSLSERRLYKDLPFLVSIIYKNGKVEKKECSLNEVIGIVSNFEKNLEVYAIASLEYSYLKFFFGGSSNSYESNSGIIEKDFHRRYDFKEGKRSY